MDNQQVIENEVQETVQDEAEGLTRKVEDHDDLENYSPEVK